MREPTDDGKHPAPGGRRNGSGRDRIAAIVRDPRTVFLYWELNGPRAAEAVSDLGADCRWYVRVLNLTEGSSTSIPVDPAARNHYLEVTPGSTYGFELAASDAERWRSVCRTDRVEVPPAEPEVRALRRGTEAAHGPARGLERLGPSAPVEVAGLRFETTALHLGSSPRRRPPDDAPDAEEKPGTR